MAVVVVVTINVRQPSYPHHLSFLTCWCTNQTSSIHIIYTQQTTIVPQCAPFIVTPGMAADLGFLGRYTDVPCDKAAVFRDTIKPTVVSHTLLSHNFKLHCSFYCHFPNTVCLHTLNFKHAHSSHCKSLICSRTVHTDIHNTVHEHWYAQCK